MWATVPSPIIRVNIFLTLLWFLLQLVSFTMLCLHFLLSWDFLVSHLNYSLTCWLPGDMLFSFCIFVNFPVLFLLWFQVLYYCDWKRCWNDFNFLKFVKNCFVTGRCSMFTWKSCVQKWYLLKSFQEWGRGR
jgi:hypothetical protein